MAASDKHSDADLVAGTTIDQHCGTGQEAASSLKSGEAANSLECGTDAVTEEQHGETTDLDDNKDQNNLVCGATSTATWTPRSTRSGKKPAALR
jgi:hypothetical protein